MSNLVYIGGQKGGSGKTTTAHLVCLGAILSKQPAAYVLTDPHRQIKSEGRPYGVLDGREGGDLAKIITASHSTKNGWLIIDGGGNRLAFDKAMNEQAQLTLLPFRASEEDLETVARDLSALPNSIAIPAAWSTNKHAQDASQRFILALEKAFPGRVISEPIYFVNSTFELLGASLDSPSTPVRNAARRAFSLVEDCFNKHVDAESTERQAANA